MIRNLLRALQISAVLQATAKELFYLGRHERIGSWELQCC